MLIKLLVGLLGIVSQSHSLSVSRPEASIETRQSNLGAPCLESTEGRQNSLLVATTNVLLESPGSRVSSQQMCPLPYKSINIGDGVLNVRIGLYLNVSCQHTPVLGYKTAANSGGKKHAGPYMVEDVYENLLYSDAANRSQQIQRGAQDFLNYWDVKAKAAFGESYNETFKDYSPLQGNLNVSIIASALYDGGYAYAFTAQDLFKKISREDSPADITDLITASGLPRKRDDVPRNNRGPPGPFPPRFSGSSRPKDPQLTPEAFAAATAILVQAMGAAMIEYANMHQELDAYDGLVLNTALAAFTNAVSFEKDPDVRNAESQPLPTKDVVARATAAILNDQIPFRGILTMFAPGMTGAHDIARKYQKAATCLPT